MTRNIVLTIIGCTLLSIVMATVCHLVFPDVLPYAAGEDDALSWRRQIAFLITTTAWSSAELAGLFTIVLIARFWNRSAVPAPVARKAKS